MFSFLVPPYLLHCFFRMVQPFEPWRDTHVTKLFHYHFYGYKGSIFIYHFHISVPTAMHTFSMILVLLLEHHAVLFAHINLLIVHTMPGNNLLLLVQVFRHVVLCWDEINNQHHDIIVALIREIIHRFHHHKTCHSLKYGQIGAIVQFFHLRR
jgi:hypothetical protein